MKTSGKISAVLTIVIICLFCTAGYCAEEKTPETPKPVIEQKRPISDESIDRFMDMLADEEPERARELESLRDSDPEKFQEQIRLEMRKVIGMRLREGRPEDEKKRGEPDRRRGRETMEGPEHKGRFGMGGPEDQEQMRREYELYLKWLEQEYPDKAAELVQMREKSPGIFERKLASSYRMYKRIFEASKDNPEYAKVLMEDTELRQKVRQLVKDINAEQDAEKRKRMTEQLREVLNKRYDLILQRKQFEYQNLLKRLEEIKKEINDKAAELEQRKTTEFKAENVEERLKELLGEIKRFEWD